MINNKQQQKELKQPDQFQQEAYKFSDWLVKNKQIVKRTLIPIAILVVGFIGYSEFSKYQADGRRAELAKVDIAYNSEMEVAQKLRTKVQEELSDLSQKKLLAETSEKIKNTTKKKNTAKVDTKALATKIEAAEKKLADIKATHTESKAQYLKFFSANKNNAQGWRAGVRFVQISLEGKKIAPVVPVLKEILSQAKGISFYQVQIRMLYVSVLEEQAKYVDALAELSQLTKLADKDLQPQVLLTKGRIQILQNNKTEAYVTFKGLIAKHASSREAGKAKTIMALWN
jgi:hypothetical protein